MQVHSRSAADTVRRRHHPALSAALDVHAPAHERPPQRPVVLNVVVELDGHHPRPLAPARWPPADHAPVLLHGVGRGETMLVDREVVLRGQRVRGREGRGEGGWRREEPVSRGQGMG
jgi:hypothetical protein